MNPEDPCQVIERGTFPVGNQKVGDFLRIEATLDLTELASRHRGGRS
jgi:hypothetical protein